MRRAAPPYLGLWRFEDLGLVDGSQEIFRHDRLCKVVGGATVQRRHRSFCRSVCSEDDHREVASGASGLREDHLARNLFPALVTYDESQVYVVFQNAQALFGRGGNEDRGAVGGRGLVRATVWRGDRPR